MTKPEWLARYKQRFIDRAELTVAQAEAEAQAEAFDVAVRHVRG